MTFEELKKRAYHDHPIPDGLNKTERLQYIAAAVSMQGTSPAKSTGRKPSRCWARCRNTRA